MNKTLTEGWKSKNEEEDDPKTKVKPFQGEFHWCGAHKHRKCREMWHRCRWHGGWERSCRVRALEGHRRQTCPCSQVPELKPPSLVTPTWFSPLSPLLPQWASSTSHRPQWTSKRFGFFRQMCTLPCITPSTEMRYFEGAWAPLLCRSPADPHKWRAFYPIDGSDLIKKRAVQSFEWKRHPLFCWNEVNWFFFFFSIMIPNMEWQVDYNY